MSLPISRIAKDKGELEQRSNRTPARKTTTPSVGFMLLWGLIHIMDLINCIAGSEDTSEIHQVPVYDPSMSPDLYFVC